ncbi:tubulin epsilon and delta complex protein 1 isoform X2 [Varanus komodoensis]|uniref:tubulin epsilon and delta complex protein 1 isoform X2 n=1 Tax=Varanus komodoensis TaxID=61221 RepID=UPI001CF7927B|nr:tubulin epsilon and delta complex protein 1 isoform X2 [Varanus komodoensis]
MEQLLTLSRLKPWDEAAVCVCDSPLRSLHRGRTPAPKERLQGQRDVRHLQWLYGRLRFQWRSWLAEQQEQCKLLHKIHSCTIGSHTNPMIGHFSATEVDVMRQPENYKQETVLDSEAGDAQLHTVGDKGSPLPSADLGCCGISRILEELAECRKDLATLRGELRERATCRKRSCSGKVQAREQDQLGDGELRLAAEEAQEAAKLKLSGLGCHHGACSIRAPHGPYRLVFKGKRPTASKMDSGRSAAPGTAAAGGMAATDVIRELRKQEAALRTALEQRQEEARRKMHRAAEGLSHVLLIPPSERPSAR